MCWLVPFRYFPHLQIFPITTHGGPGGTVGPALLRLAAVFSASASHKSEMQPDRVDVCVSSLLSALLKLLVFEEGTFKTFIAGTPVETIQMIYV